MEYNRRTLRGTLVAALLLAAGTSQATPMPSNVVVGTGDASLGGGFASLSSNGPSTYGQTFLTPDGSDFVVSSVSFWLADGVGGPSLPLNLFIMEWNELPERTGHATGPVLFESDLFFGSSALPSNWERYVFEPGITLAPSTHYVMFLHVAAGAPGSAAVLMGSSSADYADGHFVCSGPEADLDDLTSTSWLATGCNWGDGEDAAFEVKAAVSVPEPATLAMLSLGLLAMGVRRRKARI